MPTNYKGTPKYYSESISLAKFPTCAWSGDAYINWLTQNAVNNVTRIVGAVAGIGSTSGALALGTGTMSEMSVYGKSTGMATGLVGQVGSLIGDFKQASMLPNVEQGQNTGDVQFATDTNNFRFYAMRCKKESWKIIDDFFTKFGYKILEVKKPELNSRRYWNYIQIGNGEIFASGNIPQDDLETINLIAQKGTTLWHDHNSIGNYNLNNSIV